MDQPIRPYAEFGTCPTEGCGAEHALGKPSQIATRLHKGADGEYVARRLCARCGGTWTESLAGFQVYDVMPPGA